jgi:hypothetical protein
VYRTNLVFGQRHADVPRFAFDCLSTLEAEKNRSFDDK